MKKIILASRPNGNPKRTDFALVDAPMPTAGEGELLLKTLFLSLDPLIRFTLDEKPLTGYITVNPGETMYGGAVSKVVASSHDGFQVGDHVEGRTGWCEFAAVNPDKLPLRKLDPTLEPASMALGLLGMPGQTAHACVIEIGRTAAGETVAISAAAGAVGTISAQIAKLLGARVVGIAGGPEKCRALEALGFDACADYRAPDFADQLKAACPDGINVYIDNVGGAITQSVMPVLTRGARIPLCGFISYHHVGMEGPGPDRLPGFLRMINSRQLEIRGFGGALTAGPAAIDDLTKWYREGALRNVETVVDGLENAAAAFVDKFGVNDHVGKLIVKVAND